MHKHMYADLVDRFSAHYSVDEHDTLYHIQSIICESVWTTLLAELKTISTLAATAMGAKNAYVAAHAATGT